GQELYRENQSDDRMHKFTGHERDYSNQTDYMLGRTYLYPKFRFASPDPARDGWNLYAYVGNNPVNYTDPTGKALFVPILAAAWAGAELLLSAADAVEVVDVWTDDSATWGQRAWTTGAAALGAVAPGGGYSKADDLLGLAADASRVSRGTAASLRKLDDIPWGRYCRTGCEDVANRIQATVGGEIHRIEPGLPGARFLGPRGGKRTDWQYHEVVVKDGRVIDALTGPGGLPIDEFKMLWEYADDINFGF
ncbi:MAG: hypothetical protein GY722_07055, partial [bacterium]|nr:hypothetical protein [bacterium]